jgi:hypothetical protein
MPLTLRPTGLSSPAYRDWLDYVIVARTRTATPRQTITVYVDPKQGINTSGRAASLGEAKAQFLSNRQRCRADLTPSGLRSGTASAHPSGLRCPVPSTEVAATVEGRLGPPIMKS